MQAIYGLTMEDIKHASGSAKESQEGGSRVLDITK